ncbi:AAA family ATPase [uncultured Devosia sp.]|uniref:AAA family ATPase n=1 Tax=uncultured Devosia sp. TaxID=211434 RepID=UPI0035CB0CB8
MPNMLYSCVGALSRDVFKRAFGPNSVRLRAGADQMLRSYGELGSPLSAAAAGSAGLSALQCRRDAAFAGA